MRQPPIIDPAFREAVGTNDGPGYRRAKVTRRISGGFSGGAVVPPNTPQTFDILFLAKSNGTLVFPVDTTAEQKLIDQPPEGAYRNWVYFRNSSPNATDIIYVDFDKPATANSAVRLAQNEALMLDARVDQGQIYALCATATGQLSVMVSNIVLPL